MITFYGRLYKICNITITHTNIIDKYRLSVELSSIESEER